MTTTLAIRTMSRKEVQDLVAWAESEGWNPGLHDADSFWATDPEAFIAAELEGALIGGGAVTSYDGEFGFMGFFIIKPEFRGQGFGHQLWHARRQRLLARLQPGAIIGIDGVFNMQSYYAKGGFVFSHRNLRFRTEIVEAPKIDKEQDQFILPLNEIPFDQIAAYDRHCFPAQRNVFLKKWITQADAMALAYVRDGELQGYGVIRKCMEGCKIGPLFANERRGDSEGESGGDSKGQSKVADTLYARLANFALGGPLFMDVPESNPDAIAFVAKRKMTEVFGCARMYLGGFPELASERIFGVTTFELG